MEYDTRTYFEESEQDDVKGFTIIGTSAAEGYHIAEKWLKEEGDDVWVQYWIPEAQLLTRVNDGACEPVGQITEEQYEKVMDLLGMKNAGSAEAQA